MATRKKKILYGILILFCSILLAASIYINSLMPIITGYAAKNLCSGVFISGRDQKEMEAADLNFSFIKFNRNVVDFENKSVVSRFLWGRSKAIYREGFGATLLRDIDEEDLRANRFPATTGPLYNPDTIKWPLGNIIPDTLTGINLSKLDSIEKKVEVNAYNGNIYAFMVLHKGIPVAETYKPQFNKDTRFLSWSMAKSFTNAFVGILVKQGKMNVSEPAGFEEWADDERKNITLNDLLHMQSGLQWNEDYGNRSDVTVMLHCESDMGKFAYDKKYAYPAGSHWYYSSGTTNIVSKLIRKEFIDDSSYYAFTRNELFSRIGLNDAILEADPSGTFVGSSYLYATARDYARFGLLYMNDGVFNGERILPERWVEYSTSEAGNSDGKYGAFFWLNKSRRIQSAPEDMYSCNGHDGQYIFMIPSKDLVIVILGFSPGGIDLEKLLGDILATV
ncbi:MAG TPA: serine hydrolase [Bacteroidales bacterium]|nr:serine hydrolase [Bacteroidales bacterium]